MDNRLDAKQEKQIHSDLKALAEREEFARFMKWVYEQREDDIAAMHEATTDQIQQIAGHILKADQILKTCGWEYIRKKHADRI